MSSNLIDSDCIGGKLHGIVRPLLPDHIRVVEGPIIDVQHLLWPEEAACVARAVPRRRAEFSCGRVFARSAMKSFGAGDDALLVGKDRVPIWPPGLVGSISHTDRYCAVAVARKAQISVIGIDLEEMQRFPSDLARYVLSPREIEANLHQLRDQQRLERMAIIFSAKESFYKCLFPLVCAPLAFHNVEIIVDDRSTGFEGRLLTATEPFDAGHRFIGRYAIQGGYVATTVTLQPDTMAGQDTS
jgi:enterobactin synthetase component D / holo-[acyl-carrier protein] synthase